MPPPRTTGKHRPEDRRADRVDALRVVGVRRQVLDVTQLPAQDGPADRQPDRHGHGESGQATLCTDDIVERDEAGPRGAEDGPTDTRRREAPANLADAPRSMASSKARDEAVEPVPNGNRQQVERQCRHGLLPGLVRPGTSGGHDPECRDRVLGRRGDGVVQAAVRPVMSAWSRVERGTSDGSNVPGAAAPLTSPVCAAVASGCARPDSFIA